MKAKGFYDTIEWYNQNAEQYAKAVSQSATEDELKDFADLLPVGAKVLDAGCGPGRDTYLLTDKGLHVIGLDLSSGLIDVARKTYPSLEFLEGDMLSTPFPNDDFDGVWAHASLVHLETIVDVQKALAEFNRIMKKEGILHVLVRSQKGKEKTAVEKNTPSDEGRFYQYFTQKEIQVLLKEANFEIVSTEQYKETKKNPKRRPDVEWILALARKK